jgi:hypothetical protein
MTHAQFFILNWRFSRSGAKIFVIIIMKIRSRWWQFVRFGYYAELGLFIVREKIITDPNRLKSTYIDPHSCFHFQTQKSIIVHILNDTCFVNCFRDVDSRFPYRPFPILMDQNKSGYEIWHMRSFLF